MPAIYRRHCEADGIAALCARFIVLTAARSGEAIGAVDDEFTRSGLWSIPGARMKGGRSHVVPLSIEAKAVLEAAAAYRAQVCADRPDERHILPGHKRGRPVTAAGVMKALRVAGAGKATLHGLRSTFKDWTSERTSFANEVSEAALAHVVGDKTEAAYRRTDFLKKRAALMDAWAKYCTRPKIERGQVVELRHRA
jgi:integrase